MAEVLGVIASGIAVVEVVGKIGGRILALKKLWDEVQDVPDKIAELMRDIEILEPLLTELESNLTDANTIDSSSGSIEIALTYCQKAMVNLDALLKDLTINLNSSRKSSRGKAKLKVILKKDVLDRSRDRLDMSMRLLSLAQQLYMLYMPELIVRRLHSIDSSSHRQLEELSQESLNKEDQKTPAIAYSSSKNTVSRREASSFGRWNLRPFSNFAWQYTQYIGDFNTTNFDLNARIQFLQPLFCKAWEIQVSKAISGWTFNLKTYNIVPYDSKVFQYARCGDIAGIRALLDNGEASIYDRDETGRSSLWWAAFGGKVELMNFLTMWGLDINRTGEFWETTFYACLYGIAKVAQVDRFKDFLLANSAFDGDEPLILSTELSTRDFIDIMRFIHSNQTFRTIQPLFLPHHYEMPAEDRLQYFDFGPIPFGAIDADLLCSLLQKDGVLRQEDVSELQQKGISLLCLVAFSYVAFEDSRIDEYSKWRKLCRKIIGMTHDISFLQVHTKLDPYYIQWIPSATPLAMVMRRERPPVNCVSILRSALNSKLRDWLDDLQACGVDLQSYGLEEKRIFSENGWLGKRWYPYRYPYRLQFARYQRVKVRLADFEYGATPEDWVFHWDMDAERHAGQFWDSIENPRLQVPGSWVDNDSSGESCTSDEEDWEEE